MAGSSKLASQDAQVGSDCLAVASENQSVVVFPQTRFFRKRGSSVRRLKPKTSQQQENVVILETVKVINRAEENVKAWSRSAASTVLSMCRTPRQSHT